MQLVPGAKIVSPGLSDRLQHSSDGHGYSTAVCAGRRMRMWSAMLVWGASHCSASKCGSRMKTDGKHQRLSWHDMQQRVRGHRCGV